MDSVKSGLLMFMGIKNKVTNAQFQSLLVTIFVLFVFKLLTGNSDSVAVKLIGDILLLITVVFLALNIISYIKKKLASSIALVMNVGVIIALIFLIITFGDSILSLFWGDAAEMINTGGLIPSLISVAYVILIAGFLIYLIIVLRHLYFLRQGNNLHLFFNTMLTMFILASVTDHFIGSGELSFFSNTFFIVSIILISYNSIKISWIAFIIKREKIYLLILSIIITGLFIVNLISGSGENNYNQMIESFSPSMSTFSTITMIYGAVYFSILFFTTLFHIPTAEAFDRKAQEVSSLQYFSKLITRVLDFNELSETVTDITLNVGRADASWIIWKKNDEFRAIASKGAGYIDTEIINSYLIGKTKWEAFISSKFFNIEKIPDQDKLSNHFKVIATTPLKTHDVLKGILVSARKSGNNFNEEDRSAIATFSDYASVALENSRLLEESIEKERLEKELDVAREIQRKILPAKNPEYDGLEISSVFIPAFEVGGDYYDFFPISKSKLGLIIADVSGKGISAAFIMAEIKEIFESLSKTIEKPKDILIKANEILRDTLDNKTFVSAAYGLIDMDKEVLYLSRAGHCPVLHIRGESAEKIKPTGMGLGICDTEYFEETLEETIISLEENDTIVLYTDGITEAKDNELNDFGERYFTDILLENRQKNAEDIANKVIREVSLFSKDHSQYDDITLLILKLKPRESRVGQKIIINGEKEWQNSNPQL